MNENYFIEGVYLPSSRFLAVFDADEINSLLKKGILVGGNGSTYKFQYVGVVSCLKDPVYVFPKIYDRQSLTDDLLRNSVKSIENYIDTNTQFYEGVDYFGSITDNLDSSEFSVAKFLIDDFERNGFISYKEEIFEINGDGSTDWSRTISMVDPINSEGFPIYHETINNVVIDDIDNITIRIHKMCLNDVSKKYSLFLSREQLDIQFEREEIEHSDELLLAHLRNELRTTYSDREIHLLKSFIFLLTKKNIKEEESISLFGTKKYENIWEDICRRVLKDNYETIKDKYNLFPNPIWIINADPNEYKSGSDLRPDLLVIPNGSPTAYLYDAKYYKLKFEGEIKGEPGFKDILKQFMYQHHVEFELIDNHGLVRTVENAFLFPVNHERFLNLKENPQFDGNDYLVEVGRVCYQLYNGKEIKILICNMDAMKQLYNNKRTIEI
jgi:hypothetical protein